MEDISYKMCLKSHNKNYGHISKELPFVEVMNNKPLDESDDENIKYITGLLDLNRLRRLQSYSKTVLITCHLFPWDQLKQQPLQNRRQIKQSIIIPEHHS